MALAWPSVGRPSLAWRGAGSAGGRWPGPRRAVTKAGAAPRAPSRTQVPASRQAAAVVSSYDKLCTNVKSAANPIIRSRMRTLRSRDPSGPVDSASHSGNGDWRLHKAQPAWRRGLQYALRAHNSRCQRAMRSSTCARRSTPAATGASDVVGTLGGIRAMRTASPCELTRAAKAAPPWP